jgi:signal transduction histidine kinase
VARALLWELVGAAGWLWAPVPATLGGAIAALIVWPIAWVASLTVLWCHQERVDARRREAVLTACHELRAPITAVALGIELSARTGSLPDARTRALSLQLERAATAIEDLARLEEPVRAGGAAQARADARPVDVRTLLEDSVEAWRARVGERELRLRLAPRFNATVHGSRGRLAQASGNLIANAIEHGRGQIEVQARIIGDRVLIEVLDQGAGLPATIAGSSPSGHRRRTSQARRARTAIGRGPIRGRGLRIARTVANAHGGRLFSVPVTCGTRIVLELPIAGRPAERLLSAGQLPAHQR